jgi:lipoprotein-anchoring transpeptidase ErfK/SrfK
MERSVKGEAYEVKWSFLCIFLVMSLQPLQMPGDTDWEVEKASVIVNVRTNTLALIEANHIAEIHPVATGKKGDETPLGQFTVLVKVEQPYYRKKNIPGGDARNPLGSRWIGFDALGTAGRTYGLHGTNRPGSIGYSASAGCIRLANPTIERLYQKIDIGSKIFIVNEHRSFQAIAKEAGLIN